MCIVNELKDFGYYTKVAVDFGLASCSSGVIRYGIAASNTWTADISVAEGRWGGRAFTCSPAGLGVADPAPGKLKECQCLKSTKFTFDSIDQAQLWNPAGKTKLKNKVYVQ